MQAFIVRPFGTKEDINFDLIEEKLIQPALKAAEITGGTTALVFEAGNIREDMFQMLLLADIVVADISIHNANVFYELGIRHALRGMRTFLLRAKVTKPKELRTAADDVPFDLKTDRYLEYDSANPEACLATLVKGLKDTKASQRVDSPVFRSLPKLEETERGRLSPVPLGFAEDVDLAASKSQGGKLGLLGREAGRFLWETEGRRLVGRCQFSGGFALAGRETWERIRAIEPFDFEANLLLGTIYQRLDDLAQADQCLQRVVDNAQAPQAKRAEALALQARNLKARARAAFGGKETAAREALRSGLLLQARDHYAQAFKVDLNQFYPGLNALSLSVLLLELISRNRDTWNGMFDTDEKGQGEADELKASTDRLAATVGLSLEAAEKRTADKDFWLAISKADYLFLTASRDGVAAAGYARALNPAPSFHVGSARAQLELFRELNVRLDRAALCLQNFPKEDPQTSGAPRQAILFTGHMVDAPDRAKPRFPARFEGQARQAILETVRQLLDTTPGPALGIAGGANGGDILFHEVCQELGIPTRVLLTLPEGAFIAESVAHGSPEWVKRFNGLMARLDGKNEVQVLGSTKELPGWMRNPAGYDVWQRTNVWLLEEAFASKARNLSLVALWDGKGADGAGGTKDLVELARKHGVSVEILDTTVLFA